MLDPNHASPLGDPRVQTRALGKARGGELFLSKIQASVFKSGAVTVARRDKGDASTEE